VLEPHHAGAEESVTKGFCHEEILRVTSDED